MLSTALTVDVPLNNRLARVMPESAEGAGVWRHYLVARTRWNTVRTAASALVLYLLATVKPYRPQETSAGD